eukprot:TRINITY_DN8895_c0_g1_i3.p1 TRINITY_DN8895_c0_g1~~TRINITY_DN8895_c0_g1_i3.p1  ORF type:complete len:271 (+),score=34.15 TRINITY_DN8895_c0_g1_i3:97-909(+)
MAHRLIKTNQPGHHVPHGHQHDVGKVYVAVAHTQWGDIPAKAQGGTAWFSYNGGEHTTNNFSYVELAHYHLHRYSPHNPPSSAIITGHQTDCGPLYAVIAHTQWGDIPAKAKPGTAWFPYGGREHTTSDFSWITQTFSLLHISSNPQPPHTVPRVHQHDAGQVLVAIAHGPHGDIPGKAQGNTCWYPYGGGEHMTNNFSWVNLPNFSFQPNTGTIPSNAISMIQNDGQRVAIAIANSQWGQIPGKAQGSTCWFPYGGSEHTTSDFSYIVH